MRYVESVLESEYEDLTYRIYITDCFYLMGENKAPSERWFNMIDGKQTEEATEEDAKEITESIMKSAGLSFG